MLSANAFLATRGKTPGNKIVEGKDSWPARDDDEKTGRPDAVGRPGIGIDENFDDRGHAEKGQRGQAAGEAYDQQYRKEMLAEGREDRGEGGIDQWQLIFVAKQRNRIVRHVKAFDFGLPRPPEHGGRKNPCRKRNQGLRNFVQNRGDGAHRANQRRGFFYVSLEGSYHGNASSSGGLVISIASPANNAARLAARS